MDDVSLSSAGRLFQMTAADTANALNPITCSCSLSRQFRGVGRAQMTSTGYCRDQVRRYKTMKALEDDHGKLELYSLPDGEPMEDEGLYSFMRWLTYNYDSTSSRPSFNCRSNAIQPPFYSYSTAIRPRGDHSTTTSRPTAALWPK